MDSIPDSIAVAKLGQKSANAQVAPVSRLRQFQDGNGVEDDSGTFFGGERVDRCIQMAS